MTFVSVGADHECEHLNNGIKVLCGLIGISNNANTRQRFFLATPELSCLAREFKSQFGFGTAGKSEHPGLGPSEIHKNDQVINKINHLLKPQPPSPTEAT